MDSQPIPRRGAGRLVWTLLFCLTFVIHPAMSHAQEDVNAATHDAAGLRLPPRHGGHESHGAARSKNNAAASGLWTTVISLVAIVGCLLLIGYWLRPYLGAPRGLSIDALELLGRRVIDQKVAIHLVRCGSRVLVLSVSPEGARTLSEITEPDEVRRLIDACHGPADIRPMSVTANMSRGPGGGGQASSPLQPGGSRRA
jgi:flagellar biogenesis protein FliO